MASDSTDVNVTPPLSASVPVTLVCPSGPNGGPNPPTILSVAQASQASASGTTPILVFGVVQDTVTGASPITSFRLYRGNTPNGPFTYQTDLEAISAVVVVNQLFDQNPSFGIERWYVATAIDSTGLESQPSNVVSYTASLIGIGISRSTLPPAAFGPYPLLGSDVYLDPTTGEGVIGPNNDLLTVNGLECLAQDLRIRFLTEFGELALHPAFGFSKGGIIGSGQALPQVQAQILRANVIDALRAEPRVYSVLGVQVSIASDRRSWIIGYDIMAIGVEDAQHFNAVFPYYLAA